MYVARHMQHPTEQYPKQLQQSLSSPAALSKSPAATKSSEKPERKMANRDTEQKRRDMFKASIEDLRLEVTMQLKFQNKQAGNLTTLPHPQTYTKAEVLREAVDCLKWLQDRYTEVLQQKHELQLKTSCGLSIAKIQEPPDADASEPEKNGTTLTMPI
ncbi:hypothetical protein SARC_07502 [Sphaeroforma arctica JP610]|uniref:BHLH domain-containing protein n=1 Tax=Sphaeroforma arctica JP610 TaxID=667725 RepID=A0A0L0FW26_9EUKA|nr:hypothetical protein SARC_07502 [Sphaeroforma arctica JP610]KNC80128.1 hypothetical protein SARC_07502 [Sphaeroforma arctica JP610]|eukprot:XP_014154030.1 hypothetical protein SARC_07502 [Sphaeroforma arctica JP610]